MAYEFIASPSKASLVSFQAVAEELREIEGIKVESVDRHAVRVRWGGVPRRESWPEDAELSRHGDSLLLVIHTGTQQQRDHCVAVFTGVVSQVLMESVMFEET